MLDPRPLASRQGESGRAGIASVLVDASTSPRTDRLALAGDPPGRDDLAEALGDRPVRVQRAAECIELGQRRGAGAPDILDLVGGRAQPPSENRGRSGASRCSLRALRSVSIRQRA
jgi:hypothetical protein